MSHESSGKSDEWYTPAYIFDALRVRFDMDVTPARHGESFVPSDQDLIGCGLAEKWNGFVWMNPPFGGRNGLIPWLEKFIAHGNGIALTPDRTSAPWWQRCAQNTDGVLFISPKVKFIRPNGTTGDSPANGTTLFAVGSKAVLALREGARLGTLFENKERP